MTTEGPSPDRVVPSVCKICGRNAREHKAAEREEVVNHKFSTNGHLEPLRSSPQADPPAPGAPALPVPVSLGDPVLRFLLVQKGVVTADELEATEKMLRSTGILISPPR